MAPKKSNFNLFEANLYRLAENKITGYSGSYWEFCKHETSIGTAYWLYPNLGDVELTQADNWFHEVVKDETAGIALSLMMLNLFIWYWHDKQDSELQRHYQNRYDALREYALTRSDADTIFRFLD